MTGAGLDVYEERFDAREIRTKNAVWREVTRYIQRYVDADAPLLDIACDRGYFVRWAKAGERWATDIRDVSDALPADVRFVRASGLELIGQVPAEHFGTIFMSNYLEHLDSSASVIKQLKVARSLLRPGGQVIVLQPNIRLVGSGYWDFIDHKVALTERSLVEAGQMAGLRTVELITRFLPYTTKGRLPADRRLVRAYLSFPLAWRFMGRQTLYVGRRTG